MWLKLQIGLKQSFVRAALLNQGMLKGVEGSKGGFYEFTSDLVMFVFML